DLRRTVRTRMAALGVPDNVAELVIGHGKRGLARIYDQHRYFPEMREALDAWAAELRRRTTSTQRIHPMYADHRFSDGVFDSDERSKRTHQVAASRGPTQGADGG